MRCIFGKLLDYSLLPPVRSFFLLFSVSFLASNDCWCLDPDPVLPINPSVSVIFRLCLRFSVGKLPSICPLPHS